MVLPKLRGGRFDAEIAAVVRAHRQISDRLDEIERARPSSEGGHVQGVVRELAAEQRP